MFALARRPIRLRRNFRLPSNASVYLIDIEKGSDAITLVLREVNSSVTIHLWSRALDPQLNERSELHGLLETALVELNSSLRRYQVRIKRIDVLRGQVTLWDASEHVTHYLQRRSCGGSHNLACSGILPPNADVLGIIEFNRLKIYCESDNLL